MYKKTQAKKNKKKRDLIKISVQRALRVCVKKYIGLY